MKDESEHAVSSQPKEQFLTKARTVHISRRKFIHTAGAIGGAGALAALGAGLPLRAFAQTPKRGGILKVATTKDAEVLDPSNIVSDVELRVCEQLFNGLVSIDENLNIIPDLAEEWAITNDATHYEFKLRRGVAFHHGRELNADDVIFTIERFKDTWVSYVVRDLDSLRKLDDYTVQATFKQPAAHFLGSMAPRWTGIVPKDVVEKVGKDAFKSQPVGTGAFRFTEYIPFQRLVTERHADYFRAGLPYVDGIEWIPVQDESARSAQIISGTVHLDPWAPLKLLDSFKSADGVGLVGGQLRATSSLTSTARGHPSTARRCVSRFPTLPTARPSSTLPCSVKASRSRGADRAGGPPLLQQPGYLRRCTGPRPRPRVGKGGRIRWWSRSAGIAEAGSRFSDVLEILQQQWAAIGVNLKINATEAGAARARRKDGDYDVAHPRLGHPGRSARLHRRELLHRRRPQLRQMRDAGLDALLDEGVRTTEDGHARHPSTAR